MRLNVCDHALLKKPLNLSAVHGIASQAVNLPTNNALCFARLYAAEHIVEDRATGHFCRSLFYKLVRYGKVLVLGECPQFGELGFNREDLLVLDIGGFSCVKKVFRHMGRMIILHRTILQYLIECTQGVKYEFMTDISAKFGKKVKEIRLKKQMSQADLAKVLGVHSTYISGIERGVRNMALKNIERLAKALAVPIEDLIK